MMYADNETIVVLLLLYCAMMRNHVLAIYFRYENPVRFHYCRVDI
jgi:hypothetical protein